MKYFPDNRTQASTNIKQVQSVVLRMLKIMDHICSENDIHFWLEYGTMLGAVRHNGFIPWDNEADIGMMRNDFEQFSAIAANALPHDIFFQTKDTDAEYLYSSNYIEAKLRDKYSNYCNFEVNHPEFRWHNGIQVDIFIYDYDEVHGGCFTNAYERLFNHSNSYLTEAEVEYQEKCQFEDTHFYIPAGYDPYLRRNYGNYMLLPPEAERQAEYVEVFKPCRHKETLIWK